MCPDTDTIVLQGMGFTHGSEFITEIFLSEELKALNETEIATKVAESYSFVSSAYLTQYFDPETSMNDGYYKYIIPRWIQGGISYSDYGVNTYAWLQLTECTYFDNFFIDLSQFGSFFGKDCTTYLMTDTQEFGYRSTYDNPIYSQILVQDRSILQAQWNLDSLDLILGLVGGFIGLVWDSLGYILDGYESFKFSTALISEVYFTTD